jgi:hypothetical protein
LDERRAMTDLILLSADRGIEAAITGILIRYSRSSPIVLQAYTHPEHDPGVYRRAHEFLRPFHQEYRFALAVFDMKGCGAQSQDRMRIEAEVEQRLTANGWPGRAAVIAIYPELENWVWSRSPAICRVLGWSQMAEEIWDWLQNTGFLHAGDAKPHDPKTAYEKALQKARKPRSSALFRELAAAACWETCQDAAFRKLIQTLTQWFPQQS